MEKCPVCDWPLMRTAIGLTCSNFPAAHDAEVWRKSLAQRPLRQIRKRMTMCDDHSGELVEIPTASERGEHGRKRGIDACIAPIVDGLNKAGAATVASCCGHGDRPGTIALADGRELLIVSDYDIARALDRMLASIDPEPTFRDVLNYIEDLDG